MAATTITIQTAEILDGNLAILYAFNGDTGHGTAYDASDLSLSAVTFDEDTMVRMLVQWSIANGLTPETTPENLIGKTLTIDFAQLANVLTVG